MGGDWERSLVKRRAFLRGTGTAAAGLAASGMAKPSPGQESPGSGPIRIGVTGCGGRGGWLADLFAKHGNFRVAAVADYFADRVGAVGGAHGVDAERRFTGLGCHRRMVEAGGLDAVAIISPPYFHPEQAEQAVDAGLHVWLAKPAAVDMPGCRSIEESGRAATDAGRVFLVDFQTRADPFFQEAMRRVHDGALGTMAFGEALYHSGRLGIKAEPGTPEARLRNWVFDQTLSGDIITEQNIHTLDVMNWIMQVPPVRATGTGGRKVRTDVGDCWDHFAIVFEYPDGVGITFSSRQFEGHGAPGGIINRAFGSEGVLLTEYGGDVLIRGGKKSFYRGGKTSSIYESGVVANIKEFERAIRAGDAANPTVAPSVQSNAITILGRTAAYTGKPVTWDEIMGSDERLAADLEELKS